MADEIDTSQVNLPGYMAPSVADAPDDVLRQTRADGYEAIRGTLAQDGAVPDSNGFAPLDWKESRPRGDMSNLSAVERTERRIQAIDVELQRREAEREQAREAEREQARNDLETVLAEAPEQAKEMAGKAEMVCEAAERVRSLVRDIETIGGGVGIRPNFDTLTNGVEVAAKALDVEAPKLPALPEGLPSREEVRYLLNVFGARADGFQRLVSGAGKASRAQDLARKLE